MTINRMMLLYLDYTTPLHEQVKLGMAQYQKQYDKAPDLCLVNPCEFDKLIDGSDDLLLEIDGVRVRPWRGVVVRHALIGLDEEEEYESVIRIEMEEYRKANLDAAEVPA